MHLPRRLVVRPMFGMIALTCAAVAACASGGGVTSKDVAKVSAVVADGVCRELAATGGTSNEWVTLACAAEGAVSTVIVRMPRREWSAVRARGEFHTSSYASDAGEGMGK